MKVKNDHCSNFSHLSNWKEEAWKKSGRQRDSNPWPPRCRCVALPTELWNHTLGARSIYWVMNYFIYFTSFRIMLTTTPVILTTAIIFTTFHRVDERTPEVEFPYCNSMSTKRETVQPLSRDLDPGADSGSADSLMWVINTQLSLVFLFRGAREVFFWWTRFLKQTKKNYKQLGAYAAIQPHFHA